MSPSMRIALAALALIGLIAPVAQAQAQAQNAVQMDPHQHHHPVAPAAVPQDHSSHPHDLGAAGRTYDLRWIDAMVQHHTGALRMSEFVFDIGAPGVGSLAKQIWREQAQEIRAMGQWRKAWYPQAPLYPVALKPSGDPDAMADLVRMDSAQIQAMQMISAPPSPENRVSWFLEGMLHHHGGALVMARAALQRSSNPTIRRLARSIIRSQTQEILQIRRMLQHDGRSKPDAQQHNRLFNLN